VSGSCCFPPLLLYNLLFAHSDCITARVLARISQMILAFYTLVFILVMVVMTVTDAW
jgi:hypothetical protein